MIRYDVFTILYHNSQFRQTKIKRRRNKVKKYVFRTIEDINNPILRMQVASGKMSLLEAQNWANQEAAARSVSMDMAG